jgi:hypothetical protein
MEEKFVKLKKKPTKKQLYHRGLFTFFYLHDDVYTNASYGKTIKKVFCNFSTALHCISNPAERIKELSE